jgi:predicted dehydrogenase
MLKAMVIGCGRIAGGVNNLLTTHAGAYRARNGISIVACIDIDEKRRNSFAKDYDCEAELELQKALETHHPDIVSVCTPDNTHYLFAEEILLSAYIPKVIFLEKPACQTQAELDNLISLSDRVGVLIVVNHSRRFDEHHQQLKTRIFDGEFGELRRVYATYYSGWQHNGVHVIDTLSYLLNDSILVKNVNNVLESPYRSDPTLEIVGELKNTKTKIYLTEFDEKIYQIFEIDLRFNEGRLRLEDFGERILFEKKFINDFGENVIKLVDMCLPKKEYTSMQNAVELICRSIEENNLQLLDNYLLQHVSQTMQTIWQGKKMWDRNEFK